MTPAVITETLYALVTQKKFIPDAIHVITTQKGKEKIERELFGTDGQFHRFMKDYLPSQRVQFHANTMHLIATDEAPLEDITTDADNRVAADTIYRVLRQIKSLPNTQMHVSIAGGRKSMSFYMGHAFSLVADADDELSHVLVTSAFEDSKIGFYYPPKQAWVREVDGKVYKSSDAKITLAEIAALKLGGLFDADIPQRAKESFEFAVQLMQATITAPNIEVYFNEEKGHLKILDQKIPLSALEFMVFFVHAVSKRHQHELKHGGALYIGGLKPQEHQSMAKLLAAPVSARIEQNDIKSDIKKKIRTAIGPAADWFRIEARPIKNRNDHTTMHELMVPSDRILMHVSAAVEGPVLSIIKSLDNRT
jgi:CRISPR-associated protein (TIGR02584 family)